MVPLPQFKKANGVKCICAMVPCGVWSRTFIWIGQSILAWNQVAQIDYVSLDTSSFLNLAESLVRLCYDSRVHPRGTIISKGCDRLVRLRPAASVRCCGLMVKPLAMVVIWWSFLDVLVGFCYQLISWLQLFGTKSQRGWVESLSKSISSRPPLPLPPPPPQVSFKRPMGRRMRNSCLANP
jgi:hypothetical protein